MILKSWLHALYFLSVLFCMISLPFFHFFSFWCGSKGNIDTWECNPWHIFVTDVIVFVFLYFLQAWLVCVFFSSFLFFFYIDKYLLWYFCQSITFNLSFTLHWCFPLPIYLFSFAYVPHLCDQWRGKLRVWVFPSNG